MKKYMILCIGLLFFAGAVILAQTPEPPENVYEAIGDFGLYMATLGGLAVLSTFFTGFVNGLFRVLNSTVRLVISWVVPIALAFLGGIVLNIGFLMEEHWILVGLYGLGAGFISNRGYGVATIQQIILFIETLLGNRRVLEARV